MWNRGNVALILALVSTPVSGQQLHHALTPGGVLTSDTSVVCRRGYAGTVRSVPQWAKDSVYRSYHAVKIPGKCCVVDHLIPLELGGSNAIANLWPQLIGEAKQKDSLENAVYAAVCHGRVRLRTAQRQFARSWRYYLTHRPT